MLVARENTQPQGTTTQTKAGDPSHGKQNTKHGFGRNTISIVKESLILVIRGMMTRFGLPVALWCLWIIIGV